MRSGLIEFIEFVEFVEFIEFIEFVKIIPAGCPDAHLSLAIPSIAAMVLYPEITQKEIRIERGIKKIASG